MRRGVAWVAVGGALGCGRIGFDLDRTVGDAAPDIATDATRPLPAGAVLHLSFDNGLIDEAGSHSIVCRTTCPGPTAGVRGNAYAFVAANPDALVAAYAPDLDASNGFTLAVWIRMTVLPSTPYYCVLGKPVGVGSNNSHALCVDTAGRAFYHSGTVAGTDNLTGSPVGVGEWHHLALTWDTTTKRGYLDGAADGARAVPVGNDANPITVGCDLNNNTVQYPLEGALDEVMIFNRALSPAEIQELAR